MISHTRRRLDQVWEPIWETNTEIHEIEQVSRL